MNFSKKNYEHKGVNLKSVSKKIILSVVFVFASFAMVNANSSIEDKVVKVRDCVDQAMGNVETVAMVNEEDIRGEYQDYYLELYMEFYLDCMAN